MYLCDLNWVWIYKKYPNSIIKHSMGFDGPLHRAWGKFNVDIYDYISSENQLAKDLVASAFC
jgi:hypothetical protein